MGEISKPVVSLRLVYYKPSHFGEHLLLRLSTGCASAGALMKAGFCPGGMVAHVELHSQAHQGCGLRLRTLHPVPADEGQLRPVASSGPGCASCPAWVRLAALQRCPPPVAPSPRLHRGSHSPRGPVPGCATKVEAGGSESPRAQGLAPLKGGCGAVGCGRCAEHRDGVAGEAARGSLRPLGCRLHSKPGTSTV